MNRWPDTTFAKQKKENNANRAYHLARIRPPRVKTTKSLCHHALNSHRHFVAFHLTRRARTIPIAPGLALPNRLCESLYLLFAVVSLHTARPRPRKIPALA